MNRRPRGYILPLTLSLLSLSAVVLAQACRGAMSQSLLAARDAQELQQRWALLSCEHTLLPQSERLLVAREGSGHPAIQAGFDLTLGGQRWRLVFQNEQAKVNLNMLYARVGRAAVQQLATTAARSAGIGGMLRLRPLPGPQGDAASRGPIRQVFGSYGQIFSGAGAEATYASTQRITCWGDGRLNYRKCPPEAIAVVCQHDPRLMQQLLARRNSPPSLAQALDPLNLSARDGASVDELFTDSSSCFSLWIMNAAGQAGTARLAVMENAGGRTRVSRFTW